jgi:hypothetical protein
MEDFEVALPDGSSVVVSAPNAQAAAAAAPAATSAAAGPNVASKKSFPAGPKASPESG